MNVNQLIAELLSSFLSETYGITRAYPPVSSEEGAAVAVSPLLGSVITSGYFAADLLLFDRLEKSKSVFTADCEARLKAFFFERAKKITLSLPPVHPPEEEPFYPIRSETAPFGKGENLFFYNDFYENPPLYPHPDQESNESVYPLSRLMVEKPVSAPEKIYLFGGLNRQAGRCLRSVFPETPIIAVAPPDENFSEIFKTVFQSLPKTFAKNRFFYPPWAFGPLAPAAILALKIGLCPVDLSERIRRADLANRRRFISLAEFFLRTPSVKKERLKRYSIKRAFFPCERVFYSFHADTEVEMTATDTFSLTSPPCDKKYCHFASAT